jgi:hypothetical protein
MLLAEIIKLAVDDKQPLATLLRQCLILAYELNNDRLKLWANQELNGYGSSEGLPDYRVLYIGAHGNFASAYQQLNDFPIPAMMLEEKHRHYAEKIELQQAVSAYEDLVSRTESGTMFFEWPGNMVAYYQRKFFTGNLALIKAWQEVPKNVIVQVLDTVRNRTLKMALELQSELGSQDLTKITPAEVAQVDRTVVNNIYGGTNDFASGQSILHANTTISQNIICAGDKDELETVLRNSGVSDQDLKQLLDAQEKDGEKTMGSNVLAWIKTTAPKILAGGVQIATDIGQKLLTEWLMQYYGIPH